MSRFNLRKKERISYYEIEEPSFDEYIYCSQCGDYVYEYCSIHGPLLVIPDNKLYDKDNKPTHMVDASDANKSNWMRYVNCSRHWTEQNMIAFQYKGKLYYRTIKIIPRFTELMVFYGVEFAHKLCVDIRTYNKPKKTASKIVKSKNVTVPNITVLNEKNVKENENKQKKEEMTLKIVKKSNKRKEKGVNPVKTGVAYNNNAKKRKENEAHNDNITNNKTIAPTDISKTSVTITKTPQPNISKLDVVDFEETKELLQSKENIEPVKDFVPTKTNSDIKYKNLFYCDKCEYKGQARHKTSHLEMHSRESIGIKVLTCEICHFKCCDIFIMENHKESHGDKLPCSISNIYLEKLILKHHNRINRSERPYSCDICGKKFITNSKLTTHIRTHTGEKPYSCDICGKKFTVNCDLTTHIRTHTGEKPYSCDICGKKFTKNGNLTTHIRTHTGEKPYSCDICGKKFTEKRNLTTHIRIHTGEKPYSCDICGKKFTVNCNLTTHIRTHTGEKPYSCDICGKKFTVNCDLTEHIRIHTGEKPYRPVQIPSKMVKNGNKLQ